MEKFPGQEFEKKPEDIISSEVDDFIGENPLEQKIIEVEIGVSQEDFDIFNRYQEDLSYFRENAKIEELESFEEELTEFIEELENDYPEESESSLLFYLLKGEEFNETKITGPDLEGDLIRSFLDAKLG